MTEVQVGKKKKKGNVKIFSYAVEYKKTYLRDIMEKISNKIIANVEYFIEHYFVAYCNIYEIPKVSFYFCVNVVSAQMQCSVED